MISLLWGFIGACCYYGFCNAAGMKMDWRTLVIWIIGIFFGMISGMAFQK